MLEQDDFFAAVGALGSIETLDVDAMRLLYRVERAGEVFYAALAERLGDERAGDLLRRNGRGDRGHAERIRRAISCKLGRDWEPGEVEQRPYEIALPDSIPLEMLPGIVQAETDGDAGYQRWADLEADPEVQRLLRLNGREETIHAQRAQQVLDLIEARSA
ncbi:MAG: ferritin-like domain-containing protein [Alphaproteobacteria bacterium]